MIFPRSSDRSSPAIEPSALAQLFAMGGDDLRIALRAQLLTDFSRLREAVAQRDPQKTGRAIHELKGLAGTVGAHRLADLSRRLDGMGSDLRGEARSVLTEALRLEIDAVLAVLRETGEDKPNA